ncbi:MAG: ABC transporter permease [Candidatus Eisenbacteria sp.]|nr:ABC transporter permease [Candidatus Eisenbacteria bacterium]
MTPSDLWRLSLENLWRTKLRSVLTTLGVVIGIGALVSMVSFGIGMQENVTREFRENDLFTSLQVLPAKIDVGEILAGSFEPPETVRALNDSAVEAIRALPEVELAFPEIRFPVTVRMMGKEARTSLQAIPAAMGRYKPFSEIPYGSFYEGDADSAVVLTGRLLGELGFRLEEEPVDARAGESDATELIPISVDSLIGRRIEVVSSTVDLASAARTFMRSFTPPSSLPLWEEVVRLRVVGLRGRLSGFGATRFRGGIIVPIDTGAAMPRLGFSDVWDLLDSSAEEQGYGSVYVRTSGTDDVTPVREAVEEMGFGVLAVIDEFEEIKQSFLIMDALLGAVGTIALIVAALGIINTMVTSILERTREIGVMKAIGGSETDIRWIFFSEAATIGFIGGAFGLALGWAVTRMANAVANHYLRPQGVPEVDLFYMPIWLIAGAMAFSVVLSLLAGLYPASRAARVDPVQALRHD